MLFHKIIPTRLVHLVVVCFSIIAIQVLPSCRKEPIASVEVENPANVVQDRAGITITASCLTNRNQPIGGSFQHKIKVMNNGIPVAGASVGINDPIGLQCTIVKTNALGESTWIRPVPSGTKRQGYTIEFFYGGAKHYSSIAINPESGSTSLSTYKLDFTSTVSLGNNTLVGADRGGFTSTSQAISTTIQKGVQLGKDIGTDYLSNPANLATVTVAAVSCTLGEVLPPAGQAACAVSAKMVKTGLAQSTAKVLGKKMIDAQSNFTTSQKTTLKNMVDAGAVVWSVASLKPSEGIKRLDAVAAGYDLYTTAQGLLLFKGTTLKGASMAAQRKGSNEVYQMCIYKR